MPASISTRLRPADPRLVICSITPYGLTGPYAGRPATEFTVQAECGSIAGRGRPDQPPVQAGGRIAEWSAGATAAAASIAVLRRSTGWRGEGALLDVSWFEVMVLATNLYSDLMFSLMGRPQVPGPPRSVELPSIDPTADGWIGFNTNGAQHFRAFAELVGRPDLVGHPQFGQHRRPDGRPRRVGRDRPLVHDGAHDRGNPRPAPKNCGCRRPASTTARPSSTKSSSSRASSTRTDPRPACARPRPHYLRNGRRPATGRPRT